MSANRLYDWFNGVSVHNQRPSLILRPGDIFPGCLPKPMTKRIKLNRKKNQTGGCVLRYGDRDEHWIKKKAEEKDENQQICARSFLVSRRRKKMIFSVKNAASPLRESKEILMASWRVLVTWEEVTKQVKHLYLSNQ